MFLNGCATVDPAGGFEQRGGIVADSGGQHPSRTRGLFGRQQVGGRETLG